MNNDEFTSELLVSNHKIEGLDEYWTACMTYKEKEKFLLNIMSFSVHSAQGAIDNLKNAICNDIDNKFKENK